MPRLFTPGMLGSACESSPSLSLVIEPRNLLRHELEAQRLSILASSYSYTFCCHIILQLQLPRAQLPWFSPSSYSTLEVNSIMAHRLINKRVSSVEHYPGHTSLRGLYRRLPLPHLIIVLRSTLAATCFISHRIPQLLSCIHTSHSDTSTVPHPNPPFSRHAFPSLGSPSRRNFLNRQVSIIS
jgi:hypothetical protein